jgi:hypothetical protein
MVISSRTPEGSPNRCPVCGSAVYVELAQPFGDAPCPACGTLLWFVEVEKGLRFVDPETAGLVDPVAGRLGVDPEMIRNRRWEETGIDSLDLVELVMELEDTL